MKKIVGTIFLGAAVFASLASLSSCKGANAQTGEYQFIIYEPDSDNTNLSDNVVVAKYTIKYTDQKYVSDTLINKDGKYYFVDGGEDYLVLVDSSHGLSYTNAYFKNYAKCSEGAIDVSWSLTTVNGAVASKGIGQTELEGLNEYGFVIDGWK